MFNRIQMGEAPSQPPQVAHNTPGTIAKLDDHSDKLYVLCTDRCNSCPSKQASSGRSWSKKSTRCVEQTSRKRGLRKKLARATIEIGNNRALKRSAMFASLDECEPLADPPVAELEVVSDDEHDMYDNDEHDMYDNDEHATYEDEF